MNKFAVIIFKFNTTYRNKLMQKDVQPLEILKSYRIFNIAKLTTEQYNKIH
jgi:hypothetical protein